MAKGTVSEQKKPVLDEQTLDKLLEAAFVIQEQGDLRMRARKLAAADQVSPNQISTSKTPATPIAASAAAAASSFLSANPGAGKTAAEKTVSEKSEAEKSLAAGTVPTGPASISPISISKDSYTLTLAQIVETQQQILTRRLELENAMALVAQRAAEMTKAAGSAIAIVEAHTDAKKIDGKKLRYRAVSGLLTLARGSEVAIERALCFNCLRSGEVIRGADVNSDFLLDGEECRRRGIGSLIVVPIYRDSGIVGALELYFASANAFTEQDVHSCQLMAGLVTEALAREAGASSRKSLAAERATMLEALEKLRPNLAALMDSPARKESVARSAAPAASAPIAVAPRVSPAAAGISPAGVSAASLAANPSLPNPPAVSLAANVPGAVVPKKPVTPVFFCRRCGHELVGEEMFCGKCGSPRTSEYQSPTMQSKVASLWQMQQASKQNAAPAPANGSVRTAERKVNSGIPAEIQPWEAVLSELEDPFGEPEVTQELEGDWKPGSRTEPAATLRQEVIEISAAARKFASGMDAPIEQKMEQKVEQKSVRAEATIEQSFDEKSGDHEAIEQEMIEHDAFAPESLASDSLVRDSFEADAHAHEEPAKAGAAAALAAVHPLAWTSAAKAKEAFERLAASKKQNSFMRFWHERRGDVYLAVAVVLVAAVIRWSIWSEHSFDANASAAKISHRRPAPDADLSTFDKLLISLGMADPPDPVEDKGNPDTQVWVDLHSALYYCPGADLYGKTPHGKYSSQRDAQLGQFEPAYRKPCN
jgi:GAF domain-containing protein/ribosomal protein L37E